MRLGTWPTATWPDFSEQQEFFPGTQLLNFRLSAHLFAQSKYKDKSQELIIGIMSKLMDRTIGTARVEVKRFTCDSYFLLVWALYSFLAINRIVITLALTPAPSSEMSSVLEEKNTLGDTSGPWDRADQITGRGKNKKIFLFLLSILVYFWLLKFSYYLFPATLVIGWFCF